MLFTELMTQFSFTEQDLSHAIRIKIKKYNKLALLVEEAKTNLPNAKNDKEKASLEEDIKTGEEAMANMNDELCRNIESSDKNREANAKRKENIAKARENKKSSTPAKVIPIKDHPPAAPTPAKKEEGVIEVPAEEVKPEEKKKSNVLGIIGGVLVAGVLAFVGIKAYQSSKE